MFLTDAGKGILAVTILGGGLLACGDDDDDAASTTSRETTTTGDSTTTTGEAAAAAGEWHRVNLGFVSAYVLIRGREAAVVDTGTAGNAPKIQDALVAGGADWDAVRHLILTHHHPDHQGSAAAVLDAAAQATPYAGEADIGSIDTPRPLQAVGDGDEVFGLQIIATPGHTAGHVSVFDAANRYLVAGDALTIDDNGEVGGSNPQFTVDEAAAKATVRKLAGLEFETLAVGHGDPLEGGGSQAVADLAASL
jgi:glyoxylase-like metal-dependent hydrolase (beta-lactamase superfamily II)